MYTIFEQESFYLLYKIRNILVGFSLLTAGTILAQAPVNDNCENAINIPISGKGFNTGTFSGTRSDVTHATLQRAEKCVNDLEEVGNCTKTVWYKFYIPTTRNVGVVLTQQDSAIPQIFAGFNVYRIPDCGYTEQDIEGGLPPLNKFGISGNTCLEAGWYLIQVGCKQKARGELWVNLNISLPSSEIYDNYTTPFDLGVITNYTRDVNLRFDCSSIQPGENIPISDTTFTKSIWFSVSYAPNAIYNSLQITAASVPGGFKYRIFNGPVNTDSLTGSKPFMNIPENGMIMYNNCPKTGTGNTKYFVQVITSLSYSTIQVRAGNSTYTKDLWNTPDTDNKIVLQSQNTSSVKLHAFNCDGLLANHRCKNSIPEFFKWGYQRWINGQPTTVYDTFRYAGYTVIDLRIDGRIAVRTSPTNGVQNMYYYVLYKGDIRNGCNLTHLRDTMIYGSSWNNYEECLSAGVYTVLTCTKDLQNSNVNQYINIYKSDIVTKYYHPANPEKLKDFNPIKDASFSTERISFRSTDTTLTIDTAKLEGRMKFHEIYISENGDLNVEASSGLLYIFKGQLSKGTASTLSTINYNNAARAYGLFKSQWGISGKCFFLQKGYYTFVSVLPVNNYPVFNKACTPSDQWLNFFVNTSCPDNNNNDPQFAFPINNNQDVLSSAANLVNLDYVYDLQICKDCRQNSTVKPAVACEEEWLKNREKDYYYYTFYLNENASFRAPFTHTLFEGNAALNPGIVKDYSKIIAPCENGTTICNLRGKRTYTIVIAVYNDWSSQLRIYFTPHMKSPNDFAATASNLGHLSGNTSVQSSYSPITCHTNGLRSDPSRYWYYATNFVIPYKDTINKKRSYTYKNLWYTFTVDGNSKTTITSLRKNNNNNNYINFEVFRYRGPYYKDYKSTLADNFDSTNRKMKFVTQATNGSSNTVTFLNDTCGEARYFVLLYGSNYQEITDEYSLQVKTETTVTPTNGDFCSNAVTGNYTQYGTYMLNTNNSCHTYGNSYFENTPDPDIKTTWYKVSVRNLAKFDLEVQGVSSRGLIGFNVYGGSCKAMTRITGTNSPYSYFTLSCMGSGDYFIQAICREQIDESLTFNVTIKKPANSICKPYDFKFPIAQFKLKGGCNRQDTVTTTNLSTAGDDIRYDWYINNKLFSNAYTPIFTRKHPFLKDTNTIRLIVRNISELTRDTFELRYIRDTTIYKFKITGPAISLCNDTLVLRAETDFPYKLNHKWYYAFNEWSVLSYLPTYTTYWVNNTYYTVKAESDNCFFSDTFKVNLLRSLGHYRDTALCQWQRYVIKNTTGYYMYVNTSMIAPGDSLQIKSTSKLAVSYYHKGCYYTDSATINIEIGPKNLVEFDNKYVCNTTQVKLQYLKEPLQKYNWSTGDTTAFINVSSGGIYRLKGPFSKCRNLDYTWKLTMEQVNTHLLRDTTVCRNETVMFNNVFGSRYDVLFKSPNVANIKVLGPVKKQLRVKRGDCIINDSSMVYMFPHLGRVIDTFMCNEKPVFAEQLDAGSARQYNWYVHNGSNRFFTFNNYGYYPVARKDNNNCSDTLHFNVITNCEFRVYVPNAVTFNNDGLNETFGPSISGRFVRFDMKIFTRWGEAVYNTSASEPWDGTFKGNRVQDGVYCYFITVYDIYNKPYVFKGTLTVLY